MRVQVAGLQEQYTINELVLRSDRRGDLTLVSSDLSPQALARSTSESCVWHRHPIVVRCLPIESPQVRGIVSDEALFEALRVRWHQERGASSSITEILMAPAYQRIIGMGQRAVPLILAQLEREEDNPDHWGWALHAITGENPVPPEAAGDVLQIAHAWLAWARNRYAR